MWIGAAVSGSAESMMPSVPVINGMPSASIAHIAAVGGVAGEVDGVAGGPAREGIGDLYLSIGRGVHEVGVGQLVQCIVGVDFEFCRGLAQVVAMGAAVITEAA